MKSSTIILTVYVVLIIYFLCDHHNVDGMSVEAKNKTRLKVLEMFKHAYSAYMVEVEFPNGGQWAFPAEFVGGASDLSIVSFQNNAFPADELMPLSCKGRYRGSEPSRGDVDDSLGNFSLSLIDSLDTLAVLGEIEEFEKAVKLVIEKTKFDTDVIVSVFETNIRVVGGLLGGHVMAIYLKKKKFAMEWYRDELLNMAKDIGTRLLPAFNTTTGIPYPRINLKYGINSFIQQHYKDTCTACAGTMVLEFAALSRFTGDPLFEDKAHKAMDFLWNQRHRSSDLVGTVINIHNGDWIRRDSGVGAGIDSYYEYVLKAYILLGDDSYLTRFNRHYEAVMKYVSQGPLFMDVHMHRPLTASKNFMDALLAFWPGLQVLKGDIPPAIEMHEMLYQVMQKHNFLPEAFTTDFHVHWGHHPLRPEFVESTYFLYKATSDPYYLEVGQKVVDNLEAHARVPCGYAAIKDVTKGTKEDQMDSFVLAETFKYLYLLFAEKSELLLDMDDYIFTTEGHLLPLTLSRCNTSRTAAMKAIYYLLSRCNMLRTAAMRLSREMYTHLREIEEASHLEDEFGDSIHNTCPNPKIRLKQSANYAQNLRTNLNIPANSKATPRPDKQCVPSSQGVRSNRLKASQFVAGNKEHIQQLKDMGIHMATMSDGRIQLLHTASEAVNPQMAEEGFIFMQEMIDLSKVQPSDVNNEPMILQVLSSAFSNEVFRAGPAQFGYDLKTRPPVKSQLEIARPFKSCSPIQNPYHVKGKIAIIERGDCMFVDKARMLQKAGAVGGICIDHTDGSSIDTQPLFAMSGDGTNDVSIPIVFLFKKEGDKLLEFLDKDPSLIVRLAAKLEVVGSVIEPSGPGQYTDKQEGKQDTGAEPFTSYQKKVFEPLIPLTPVNENGEYVVNDDQGQTVKVDNIIEFKKLHDGSQQIHFRFDKLQGTSPDLSSIYQNVVKVLLERTNFPKLDSQSEYLTAIAKLLEGAYSSTNNVDQHFKKVFSDLTNELEVLSDEELSEESEEIFREESLWGSSEGAGSSHNVKSTSNDENVQVYNMEGVTIRVKTSSPKSDKLPDHSSSHVNSDQVHIGEGRESYAGKSDFEEPPPASLKSESEQSQRGGKMENLYSKVWSKTSEFEFDAESIEADEDFKQLVAINSDLAQKLKSALIKGKGQPEQQSQQQQTSIKVVRVLKSGNQVITENVDQIIEEFERNNVEQSDNSNKKLDQSHTKPVESDNIGDNSNENLDQSHTDSVESDNMGDKDETSSGASRRIKDDL